MAGKLQNEQRSSIIFIIMIIMMAALFFSRAALSVSILVFFSVCFFHTELKKQLHHFFSSPLLWGMSLLFFLPLLSGLWSDDKKEWLDIMRIKLPLLILPLAFAGSWHISKKQGEWLAAVFISLVTAASVWSMFQYVSNHEAINKEYLQAKSINTLLENDHVRFSWLISVAALLSGWFMVMKRKRARWFSIVAAFMFCWLVIFLHILAARTGLLSFYIMMTGVSFWFILKKAKRQYGFILILFLAALPFVAYRVVPTFQNKVKYFMYDMGYFKKTNYLPGANDAVRIISLKAGWHVLNSHPVKGAGYGDIHAETGKWYDEYVPGMLEADKIYPSGQWLLYGAGCGWPGLSIFIFVMIIPFRVKTTNRLLWWLLNAAAAFSFLFDIGMEVQFGVFIYSFVVLWWWKWLSAEKM